VKEVLDTHRCVCMLPFLHHCSIRAATYTSLEEGGISPLPKRAKPTYLAMDKENQIIGYVVPIFRGR